MPTLQQTPTWRSSTSPWPTGGLRLPVGPRRCRVATDLVIDIVGRALQICGISGYRQGGEMSIGRHLRDAHGSAIMVSNERILGHNAQLSLVYKGK